MDSKIFSLALFGSVLVHGAFFLIGDFGESSKGAFVQFKQGQSSIAIQLSNVEKRGSRNTLIEKKKKTREKKSSEISSKDSSGVLTGALALEEVAPEYPKRSILFQEEGSVTLIVDIDENGVVKSALVEKSSGHDRLDKAALVAANKVKFNPATKNGIKVSSREEITFNFKLK